MIKEQFTIIEKSMSVNLVQTEIESVRRKDLKRTGIRMFDGRHIGIAGALGSFNTGELEKRAVSALDNRIPYPFEQAGDNVNQYSSKNEMMHENQLPDEVDSLVTYLRKTHPEFSFSNKLQLKTLNISLSNSQNLKLDYKVNYLSAAVLIKHKSSASIIDGAVSWTGRFYDRSEVLRLFDEYCQAYLNPVDLPKDPILPVVFLTSETRPLSKIVQNLNGLHYGSGSSIFSGKIGEKLFSEHFSLDHLLDPEQRIGPFFDVEGTVNPGYTYPMISEGVLKAVYTDKKTAHEYELPLTGSASGTFDSVPTVGLIDAHIRPTDKTAAELLQGKPAIFVSMAAGGDFTPDGDFASPVQMAYLFDGKRLIGRLPELQIHSNMYKMFGDDFTGVSCDQWSSMSEDRYLIMNMAVRKI